MDLAVSLIIELTGRSSSMMWSPATPVKVFNPLTHYFFDMKDLPQELVERICHFLPRDALKSVLFVSRKFQNAAERASTAFLRFVFKDHSPEEHQKFVSIFSGRRFSYLQVITIQTEFPALEPKYKPPRRGRKKKRAPTPEPEPGSCRESPKDLRDKDELFTYQVAKAFEAIKTVEDIGDNQFVRKKHLEVRTPERRVHKCYCSHRLFSSWRIHLLSPDRLPKLRSIYGLHIRNLRRSPELRYYNGYEIAQSRIDLRMLIDLAAKCSNLEYLRCDLGADEWTDSEDPALEHYKHNHLGPLRDTRFDFAAAVDEIELPSSLQHVNLNFIKDLYEALSEQRRPLPNLVAPKPYDPFSSSLRLLSFHLQKMTLRVVADRTLFWAHDGSDHFWPNLEYLHVMIHFGSPSGEWYFQGPPEGGWYHQDMDVSEEPIYPPLVDNDNHKEFYSDSSDSLSRGLPAFRIVPIEDTLEPVLESFARAASNMPKLKRCFVGIPLKFHLEDEESEDEESEEEGSEEDHGAAGNGAATALYPEGSLVWSIDYVAPGGLSIEGENTSPFRKIWWRVGQWRPNEELHKLFQNIGKNYTSSQFMEHWMDLRKDNWLD